MNKKFTRWAKYDFFQMLKAATKTPTRKAALGAAVVVLLWAVRKRMSKNSDEIKNIKINKKQGKGNVDRAFIRRILGLLKVVIPGVRSSEFAIMLTLTSFLVIRTFLSIYLASVNGSIVKAIVKRNFGMFLKRIVILALYAVPSSSVNSMLEYLGKLLALRFRKRLTDYFNERYLAGMTYYQLSNLDSRISNPDQRLTQDIDKWAHSLSSLYSNFSKPLLDIVLFSKKLAELVGFEGPLLVIGWYFFSGVLLRFISPSFGKLTAIEQKLEGSYRACHSDLLNHCEEIAFYKGNEWEKKKINETFMSLYKHIELVLHKRLLMGTFDSMLVKYGAVMVGYAVVGLPVFGSRKDEYLARVGNDQSSITRDYVRNSSLLINLAKAIGRIVVSYKEVQNLAGYTSLVYELKNVLDDLDKGHYERTMVTNNILKIEDAKNYGRGEYIESEFIKFDEVPIVSPNGDTLVSSMSFEIKPGMNCIIAGPNGCGKSSLFRILGELWPLFGGKLYKPSMEHIFYIPQRPYLPSGTLRDQIIYPHSYAQMLKNKKKTDKDLEALLEVVHLDYLIEREGGFDAMNDWNDVLSGGEKQRIAMTRLFYHKPTFAILDECTSAVSLDVEAIMYNHSKDIGITLITVSHRPSLWKFHDFLLKFDGEGNWTFEKLIREQVNSK